MSKLKFKLKSGNGNNDGKHNEDSLSNVSLDIKSQSKRLVRTTNGLCRDSLTLYRNFNGLMRNFYQENYREVNNVSIIDSQSLRKTSVRHIEGKELDGRAGADGMCDELDKEKKRHFNQIPREKDDTILLVEKSSGLKKKKQTRRKRVIVWNAWVIDTSSESSSSESEG